MVYGDPRKDLALEVVPVELHKGGTCPCTMENIYATAIPPIGQLCQTQRV